MLEGGHSGHDSAARHRGCEGALAHLRQGFEQRVRGVGGVGRLALGEKPWPAPPRSGLKVGEPREFGDDELVADIDLGSIAGNDSNSVRHAHSRARIVGGG